MKMKIWLGITVSLFFLFFLSRFIEWDNFKRIYSEIDCFRFIIGFSFLVLANVMRSIRFQTMDIHGYNLRCWWFISQNYNFITATLPGGVGEIGTAWILKRYQFFSFLQAIKIFLITRIMDLLVFSLLMLIAVLQLGSGTVFYDSAVFVAVVFIIISSLALLPSMERILLKLIKKILPGHSSLACKINDKLNILLQISETPRYLRKLTVALILSSLVVLGAALSVHYVLLSLGTGFSWQQSFYCFSIYALFQFVPIQGIAGIGTQAAWWALALRAAGYDGSDYGEIGFFLHGIFYLFIGFIALTAVVGWSSGTFRKPNESAL